MYSPESSAAPERTLDAHLHIWDAAEVDIPWLQEAGLPLRADIPDQEPQRSYVLVEADAADPAREADWLIRKATQDPRIHGAVISVPLEAPDSGQQLETMAQQEAVVGVRRLLQDRDLFEDAGFGEGLRQLTTYGMPFDACVRAHELPALHRLAEQHPQLTIVLDHMGKPPVADREAMQVWQRDLERLAELPQLCCKLSGLPAECETEDELQAALPETVGTVLEIFGPQRCLIGSDRPVSAWSRDWCEQALGLVSDQHRSAVGFGNAAAIYRRQRL